MSNPLPSISTEPASSFFEMVIFSPLSVVIKVMYLFDDSAISNAVELLSTRRMSRPPPDMSMSPPTTMPELNVALPASDMSSARAVTVDPPSFPLKSMSLSDTDEATTKSLLALVSEPNCVPPAFNSMSLPAASRVTSATESSVMLPLFVD